MVLLCIISNYTYNIYIFIYIYIYIYIHIIIYYIYISFIYKICYVIISWMITYAIGRRIDGTQKWSLGLFAEATWSSFPLPEPWCAYRGDLAIKTWGVHIISDAIINYSGKSMIIGRITNIIWIIIYPYPPSW